MSKKIFFLLSIFFIVLSQITYSQLVVSEKKTKDTLQKYRKSDAISHQYSETFFVKKQYSEFSLLNLALHSQQKQDYVAYLFWLNLYFQANPNIKASEKISSVANAYQLAGYQQSDARWLQVLYYHYYNEIALVLISLSLFLSVLFFTRKKKRLISRTSIFALLFILLSLVLLNIVPPINEAIIKSENTYLMTAPSGASQVAGIAQKGEKMTIIDESDIWLKVFWGKQQVFVRKTNVYFGKLF